MHLNGIGNLKIQVVQFLKDENIKCHTSEDGEWGRGRWNFSFQISAMCDKNYLLTAPYTENLQIQFKCRKIWTRKALNTDTFYEAHKPITVLIAHVVRALKSSHLITEVIRSPIQASWQQPNKIFLRHWKLALKRSRPSLLYSKQTLWVWRRKG